ncbi:MAG: tryptophan synthase subunit alpha [Deltaproteobacteria bacterium]|nr:tryptophan synthase subunit alpha [Deltaproteobacteria bacterium]
MSRVEKVFRKLQQKDGKALITYITAGDPTISVSREIILELIRVGADIIELGVPFSDPTADGPVIQAACQRALKGRVTLPDILSLVKDIRRISDIPIILFGYYNPFFVFGPEEICRKAKEAGADGFLVVDLPYEAADELKQYTDQMEMDLISLLAPTSNERRIKMISENARGFLYYISMTGVTGAHHLCGQPTLDTIERIKKVSTVPVAIGFGISAPEQARFAGTVADGVVVGSAIVRIIEENQHSRQLPRKVGEFVAQLRKAV